MKLISCFSGIEAASVASKDLGWEPVAFSDIEPFATALLAHHYPLFPNLGDFTTIDWSPYHGKTDIVVGGPPCQAFSVAGLRQSLADPRGNLTLEYMCAIHAIKPRWMLAENVPGILSAKGNPFGSFLAGLAGYDAPIEPLGDKWSACGHLVAANEESYSLAWRILDAQHFGVPQRRRRVFVVGHLGRREWWKPVEVLLERSGVPRDSTQGGEAGKDTASSAGGCIAVCTGHTNANGSNVSIDVSPTLDRATPAAVLVTEAYAAGSFGDYQPGVGTLRSGKRGEETIVCMESEQSKAPLLARMTALGQYEIDGTASTMKSRDYKDATDLVISTSEPMCFEPGAISRLSSSKVSALAPTLRAQMGDNQPAVMACGYDGDVLGDRTGTLLRGEGHVVDTSHFLHQGSTLRRLTPMECERLQGFPDNYTQITYRNRPATQCPDGPRYRALGNSWAVPVVKWIFARLDQVDKRERW